MDANDDVLEALGRYALRFVKPGHILGLGTGLAARAFIRALGASGIEVRGVPTSKANDELGRSVGIPIFTLEWARRVGTDFYGTAELGPRLNLLQCYDVEAVA